jgi:polysaccharide export outer membrane protein
LCPFKARPISTGIRAAYISKKVYTSVDVSVSVTERFVYVSGKVAKPGRIIWTADLTVAKAVQTAGGFSLYAEKDKVPLVRDLTACELNARLAQQNPAQDPRLMSDDSPQVPRSAF